jgi:propanediol utilization protein
MSDPMAEEITGKILERLERSKMPIPVAVSNRHVHLTQEAWDVLYGKGTQPRKFRTLVQPGWWAAFEVLRLEGPKGVIDKVRVIAPHRRQTQVEISKTDAVALGVKPPVRESGKLAGSAGIRLVGPKGALDIQEGVIISHRHIHFAPAEAVKFGIKQGEIVRVRAGIGGEREMVFEQVLCRISDTYALEFHVDTDEANASLVKQGDTVYIV